MMVMMMSPLISLELLLTSKYVRVKVIVVESSDYSSQK